MFRMFETSGLFFMLFIKCGLLLLLQFLKIFHLLRFQKFVNTAEMFSDATMTEFINLADKTI